MPDVPRAMIENAVTQTVGRVTDNTLFETEARAAMRRAGVSVEDGETCFKIAAVLRQLARRQTTEEGAAVTIRKLLEAAWGEQLS